MTVAPPIGLSLFALLAALVFLPQHVVGEPSNVGEPYDSREQRPTAIEVLDTASPPGATPLASSVGTPPEGEIDAGVGMPIEQLLQPDGTLNLQDSYRGSVSLEGWRMSEGPDGSPRFEREAQPPPQEMQVSATGDAQWEDGFFGPGLDSWARSLAADGNGNVYAGGDFTTAGGESASRIARWDGTSWSSLGQGMDNAVRVLALDGDGNLYAGGFFTTAGGVDASYVARWDGTSWSSLGSGTNGDVYALALDGDGNLYAGGDFTTAGGVSARSVARWDGTSWSSLGSGVNRRVYAFALDGDGSLYAGGLFTTAGGESASYVARWDGTSWSSLGSGMDSFVYSLALDGDGNLYAGGAFTTAGGESASRIARWNGTGWSSLGSGMEDSVFGLALDGDGNLYAGGDHRIARWDGTSWSSLGILNASVLALALDGDGNLYAGGSFTSIGGVDPSRVARWDGTSWSSLGPGVNGDVYALALGGDGNLYAGGTFTTAGDVIANHIVRWDGTNWLSLGSGMNANVYSLALDGDGNLYAGGVFLTAGGESASRIARWDGTGWSSVGSGMNANVYSLALDGDGNLYAGGAFSTAGGESASRIARWDGTSWSSLGPGTDGIVNALALDGDGNLYVGGAFSTAGGEGASKIARWDGTGWSSLGSGMDGDVKALALDGNGNLYAGGAFTTAGGESANHIARWDGTSWSSLGSGMSPIVDTLAPDGDGSLYAGGFFYNAGDERVNHIARWDGTSWSSLGSGMNQTVRALAPDGNGNLYAGGGFTTAGGKPSWKFAIWHGGDELFADLLVQSTDLPDTVSVGETVSWGVTVENGGSGSAIAPWHDTALIALDEEGSDPLLIESQERGDDLGVEESYEFAFSVAPPFSQSGAHRFDFLVDSKDDVVEGVDGEVNNEASSVFFVVAPDLVPTGLSSTGIGEPFGPATTSWTVENEGSTEADGSWTDRIVLSRNDVPGDADDIEIGGSGQVGPLSRGDTYSDSIDWELPAESGAYWIFLIVDADESVEELEGEANNVLSFGPVQVVDPPGVIDPGDCVGGPILFSWDPVANANAYRLEIATAPKEESIFEVVTLSEMTSYVFEGPLTEGTVYYARAAASFDGGLSYGPPGIFSDGVLVDLTAPTAFAPSVSVDGIVRITYELEGQDNFTLDSFFVQVDTTDSFAEPVLESTVPNGSSVEFIGEAGQTYYARALAIDCADNQSLFSPNSVVTLGEPPNLVVAQVSAATQGLAGYAVPIEYRVANEGVGDATGTWVDQIRLSPTPVFGDGDEILLEPELSVSGPLLAGTSYLRSGAFFLPVQPDTYWVEVSTDWDDDVEELEGDGLDNAKVAASPLIVLPAPLPDLVIESATEIAGPVPSGAQIAFRYTVGNVGSGPTETSSWRDTFFLLEAGEQEAFRTTACLDGFRQLGDEAIAIHLDPGQSYSRDIVVSVPDDIAGTYFLGVRTDHVVGSCQSCGPGRRCQVSELDEGNNEWVGSGFSVVLSEQPDLYVDAATIASPKNPQSGNPLLVTWTVSNQGSAESDTGTWQDDVFLSIDGNSSISTGDLLIGSRNRSGAPLAPEDDSPGLAEAFIPVEVFGSRFVKIRTDATNVVSEAGGGETNNVSAGLLPLSIAASPTFDLFAESLEGDSTGTAGHLAQVTWSVTANDITLLQFDRSWYDSIYVSTDAELDDADLALAGFRRTTNRQADGSYSLDDYTTTQNVRLPDGLEDLEYFFIVQVDAGDRLFENPDARPNVVASGPIRIDTRLANLVPGIDPSPERSLPGTVYAGERVALTWRVTNDGEIMTPVDRWADRVYLSTGPGLDGFSTWTLLEAFRPGALEPGVRYQDTKNATVPLVPAGDYFWVIQTDSRAEVLENDESDNLHIEPVHLVPDRPDLLPDSLTAGSSVRAGDALTVEWLVTNVGSIETDAVGWDDEVGLIGSSGEYVRLGRTSFSGSLVPQSSYSRSRNFTVPPYLAGEFTVSVRIDAGDRLNELSEGNNRLDGSQTLQVFAAELPDLVAVEARAESATALSGQPLDVTWRVANIGTGEAPNSTRQDRFYLSRDQFFDTQFDTYLGESIQPNPSPGDTNLVASTVDVPLGPQGPYFVILRTDANNAIAEGNESNNTAVSDWVEFVLPDSSDLVPATISSVTSVLSGDEAQISWSVHNEGPNVVLGRWTDDLYLSLDPTLDPGDTRIGSFRDEPGELARGDSVLVSVAATIPGVVPGDYYVVADADVRNEIPETDEANNEKASAQTLRVEMSEVPIGGAVVDPLVAQGESRYFQIHAPADSALTIACTGDLDDWVQLYVALDRVPTQGAFDFAALAYGRSSQTIQVPRTGEGTYYVLALRARGEVVADLEVRSEFTPFSITSVVPTRAGAGPVTFVLEGTRWSPQTSFALRSGADVFAPEEVRFEGPGRVRARFDLSGFPLGFYDVLASDPDGGSTLLASAVRIDSPSGLLGDLNLDLGPSVRKGTASRSSLIATNRGNVDIDAILLLAATRSDPNVRLSLPQAPDTTAGTSPSLDLRQALAFRFAPGESVEESVEAFVQREYPDSIFDLGYNAALMDESGVLGYLGDLLEQLRRKVVADPEAPSEVVDLGLSIQNWTSAMAIGTSQFLDSHASGYGDVVSICDLLVGITELGFSEAGIGDAGALAEIVAGPSCEDPCGFFPESFACELFCSLTANEGCPEPDFAFGDVVCGGVGCVRPWPAVSADDPNEKGGERGYGPENWIALLEPIRYRIYFENVAEASAPAGRVVITDELADVDFDPGSFIPTAFRISGRDYAIQGRNPYYYERIDLRESRDVYVDVTARIDVSRNPPRIEWFFQTIDPMTGRPPTDPQRGFLPPNLESPQGEAFVEFLLNANQQVSASAILENTSRIVFDQNEAIQTNFVQYRVDRDAPFSAIEALPDTVYSTNFDLTWNGTDPGEASGLASHSLYVSRDGGPFSLEAAGIMGNGYRFTGVPGESYSFYTVAVDNAGNREPEGASGDATVFLANVTPIWPGDIDNNGVVTEADVLPLGIYFAAEGPARETADRNWSEQYATIWDPLPATFADADGDGSVTEGDLLPVGLNFGLSWEGGVSSREESLYADGEAPAASDADPGLDTGLAPAMGSSSASSLDLGSADSYRVRLRWNSEDGETGTRNGLDGFSLALEWSDGLVLDSLLVEPRVASGSALRFERRSNESHRVYYAFSRLGTAPGLEPGDLLTLVFRNASDAPSSSRREVRFERSSIRVGDEIRGGGLDVALEGGRPSVFFTLPPQPNPSRADFVLRFGLPESREVQIDVFDVSGRRVLRPLPKTALAPGWHTYPVLVDQLPSGVYFSRIRAGSEEKSAKVVVIR